MLDHTGGACYTAPVVASRVPRVPQLRGRLVVMDNQVKFVPDTTPSLLAPLANSLSHHRSTGGAVMDKNKQETPVTKKVTIQIRKLEKLETTGCRDIPCAG